MNGLALLMIGLVGGSGVSDYARGLDSAGSTRRRLTPRPTA